MGARCEHGRLQTESCDECREKYAAPLPTQKAAEQLHALLGEALKLRRRMVSGDTPLSLIGYPITECGALQIARSLASLLESTVP